MNKLILVAILAVAPATFAKGKKTGTAQTHHCVVNGSEVQKTKKECKKAGGTWEKGAPASASSGSTTPSTTTPPAK